MRINFLFFLWLVACCIQLNAQDTEGSQLHGLLKTAVENYPTLKSKSFQVQAAVEHVSITKRTLVPSLDAAYQLNYATYNNITGMNYPQYLVPISGPPSIDNKFDGIFGSAASLLGNWQPVNFGRRAAELDYNNAGVTLARADEGNEIFLHKVRLIETYLEVLTAAELLKVYKDNLVRAEASLTAIRSLVIAGIKPGVDSALLHAELTRIKLDLLSIQKQQDGLLINLSHLLAIDTNIVITDNRFSQNLPVTNPIGDSVRNPLISLYEADIELSKLRRKSITKSIMPVLGIWGTAYARGSGIDFNGAVKSTEGLAFQRFNYGIGLQLSIPLLQQVRIRPQLRQQDFIIKANEEKLKNVSLLLNKQQKIADLNLANAISVANQGPVLSASAEFAYRALQSRYESGLANFPELLQAQYSLLRAETEARTAVLAVWKALLSKAAAFGDLNLFMTQVN